MTAHEKWVLALYRASAADQRFAVDGLLYRFVCGTREGSARLERESSPLLDHVLGS